MKLDLDKSNPSAKSKPNVEKSKPNAETWSAKSNRRRASQTRRRDRQRAIHRRAKSGSTIGMVWSKSIPLATYEDRSGPDQDLRRAKFGCVNLCCRCRCSRCRLEYFLSYLVSQQNRLNRFGSRFFRLNRRFPVFSGLSSFLVFKKNWTGLLPGSRSNRLNRPVRSGF